MSKASEGAERSARRAKAQLDRVRRDGQDPLMLQRRSVFVLFALLTLGATACSGGRGKSGPQGTDMAIGPDGNPNGPDGVVYGHSDSVLYTVDPTSYAVQMVAPFGWPADSEGEQMTDIAIDQNGNMIGISFDAVYAVDKTNAACTYLSAFAGGDFNGLSFIAGAAIEGSAEVLVGADEDGNVYSINPMTGTQTQIGSYGNGLGSSGDLVSVAGASYATVRSSAVNDQLVEIDGSTGTVIKTIGDTGVQNIWGLGYWKQKLFGFTESSGLVILDINNGSSTPVSGGDISWYGAGVTTAAPTTIQ
jgi:hypothetical protein